MKEEKFSSLEELYHSLLPALKTKMSEMKREKMRITEIEIWNYFCKTIWPSKNALTLGEMVNDILNTDSFEIYSSRK